MILASCRNKCLSKVKQVPWSNIFSAALGKFSALCLIISLILTISMVSQGSTYVSIVSNHPNVLCPSKSASTWLSRTGLVWYSLVAVMLYLFCFLSCFDELPLGRGWPLIFVGVVWLLFTLCPLLISSLTQENWTLISQQNSSIMFQYFNGEVYPVMLTIDQNYVDEFNLTCNRIGIDGVCDPGSPLPPLLSSASNAFRCRPGSREGLELYSSYMSTSSVYSQTSVNLGFAASFFMILAFTITICLRFSRLCGFFGTSKPDENSPLLPSQQHEYYALKIL